MRGQSIPTLGAWLEMEYTEIAIIVNSNHSNNSNHSLYSLGALCASLCAQCDLI